MMKPIVVYMLIVGFYAEVLYAMESDFSIEAAYAQTMKTSTYNSETIKEKNIDYIPLKINFDKKEIQKAYERWKKYNTGTYVFVCYKHVSIGNFSVLQFVKNNKIARIMKLSDDNSFFNITDSVMNIKELKKRTQSRKQRKILALFLDCYIDRLFDIVLNGYFEKGYYGNFKMDLEFNRQYNYISELNVKKIPNKIYFSKHSHSYHIRTEKLLMLPKDTEYTQDVIAKIVRLYDKANRCEKEALASDKTDRDENLTALEKAVGKAKLECLDKYLVWDENVSR